MKKYFVFVFLFTGLLQASAPKAKTSSADYFVDVDFLYWQALEGGLDYGISRDYQFPSPNPPLFGGNISAQGELLFGSYDWNPGFRVNFGKQYPNLFWDVEGNFTYFYTKGKQTSTPVRGGVLRGTYPSLSGSEGLTAAENRVYLHYLTSELTFARHFSLHRFFVRLIGGLKAASLDRNRTIYYFDTTNQVTLNYSPQNNITIDWKFLGAGPEGGLSGNIELGYGLSIYGKASVAGLYGYHKLKSSSFFPQLTTFPMQDIKPTDHRIVWNTQLLAGIGWRKFLETWAVSILVSYESQNWLNASENYRFRKVRLESREPFYSSYQLSVYGLTTRLNFDF